MMWWEWGDWGWGMGLMIFLTVIFWGGIIALVVWGITRITRGNRTGGGTGENRSPLDIARERYAKGEITKEQFDQLKKDLSG